MLPSKRTVKWGQGYWNGCMKPHWRRNSVCAAFPPSGNCPQPVIYKGEELEDEGYRIDLLVEDSIIVELKTVAQLLPIHESQGLTCLRLSGKNPGLLINFHVPLLKDGIKRLVHHFPSE